MARASPTFLARPALPQFDRFVVVQPPFVVRAPGSACTAGHYSSKSVFAHVLLLAAVVIAGCDGPGPVAGSTHLAPDRAPAHDSQSVLRVRVDGTRDRIWRLALDHVAVFHRPTRRLIARIELPPWFVAAFVCQPDIAFDARGTAFISHNLEPKLWRIDSDDFELSERTFRLLNGEDLDIGFGTLAVGTDGTLFGVASTGGGLWRIDPEGATAYQVEHARALHDCGSGGSM